MTQTIQRLSDIAFTDTVKMVQERKGSRRSYERMYERDVKVSGFNPTVTADLESFIATQNSMFLSTVNRAGKPYIQHRGGPPGFLKVIDPKTLAFADYKGNRQYISQGNLLDNPNAFLFLIDYTHKARVKIWGEAEVIEDDEALLQSLMPPKQEYRALPEQVIRFHVHVWDGNCPQHIPVRYDTDAVEKALQQKDDQIARLQAQLEAVN